MNIKSIFLLIIILKFKNNMKLKIKFLKKEIIWIKNDKLSLN